MTLPDAGAPERLERPHSKSDLFFSFSALALQGFGGVLAVVQRELVEKKRWMTREQFVEDWAVAQILPGPNVVNLALMIGGRYFGLGGAFAALAGMLAAPFCVVIALAMLFGGVADHPVTQGALRGMGAVAAGLITATGLKLIGALKSNPMGLAASWLFAGLTFSAIGLMHWPLASVLLIVGAPACAWAYVALGRIDAAAAVQRGAAGHNDQGGA